MGAFVDVSDMDLTDGENLFNAAVTGGKMLPNGTHSVKITGIDVADGDKYLKVTFENEEISKTLTHRVFLRDYKEPKRWGNDFLSLVMGIFGTPTEGLAFLKAWKDRPPLIQALTGLKLKITVEPGTKGYTTQNIGSTIILLDAGDGKTAPLLAAANPPEFSGFDAVKTWVDAYNASALPAAKLYRAFPKVGKYTRIDEEYAKNVQHVQTAIEATPSAAASSRAFNAQLLGFAGTPA